MAPWPPLAMPLATQCNMLRLLPHSDTVCVNADAVSALLMTLPITGRLLSWDTQVSKQATVLVLQPALPPHPRRVRGPPTMIFTSAGNVMPQSLVVPSLMTTNDGSGG